MRPGSRSRAGLERLRDGYSRRQLIDQADGAARTPIHVQRHQLPAAWGDRASGPAEIAAGFRAATRSSQPLGMTDTMFKPAAFAEARGSLRPRYCHRPRPRCAAWFTIRRRALWAELPDTRDCFRQPADLAKFARHDARLRREERCPRLLPLTVRRFHDAAKPGRRERRARSRLGYRHAHSPATRGDLFPVGSFGHTGFTGTSMWIDPSTETFVILLTNSVHPKMRPPITSLRSKVASAAAAGLEISRRRSLLPAVRTCGACAAKSASNGAGI